MGCPWESNGLRMDWKSLFAHIQEVFYLWTKKEVFYTLGKTGKSSLIDFLAPIYSGLPKETLYIKDTALTIVNQTRCS